MLQEISSPISRPARGSILALTHGFLPDIHADTKTDVLHALAGAASTLAPTVSAQHIFNTLWNREELGSTGIEAGIAIPHGCLKAISSPILVVGKSAVPVDFGAVDEMPTDLFFTILAPVTGVDHLELLSQLARMFQLPEYAGRMRYCWTADEMCLCFTDWEAAC